MKKPSTASLLVEKLELRPPLPTSEYEYENIFVFVTVDWCGKFEIFYYKYRNVFVACLFSPRTDVVFVFSEYANEYDFVVVFFILPHQFFLQIQVQI